MDILFFVILPLATVLITIVLQKLLKSPILVAILAFAVYLILAFTAFTTEFLINALIYTIIAFVTAFIFKAICCLRRRFDFEDCNSDICDNNNENLREDISTLNNSIELLENNIDNLTDILSSLANNNGCGCNSRRIKG